MTQSFALMMRDRAVAVLECLPGQGAIHKARSWKVNPEEMPVTLVFFHTETQTSKGMGAPPMFVSTPKLIFEHYEKGDASEEIEAALDAWRMQTIEYLMASTYFMAKPLEKITAIDSVMLEREGQFQYQHAQVQFTLQTTEKYQPGPFPDLTLIDAKLLDPKGRTVAEVKIKPES